jgi:uncharacterized protein YecE (DUF72 family)
VSEQAGQVPLTPPSRQASTPLAVGGTTVRVGTCSWTDATLVKDTSWYPKKTMGAGERLAFYASRFPIVEADSTYYRPPSPELARSWAERAPAGFRFDIKAYGLLTGHPVDPVTLWPDIRETLDDQAAGKRRVYAHHLPPDALEETWARFVQSLGPLHDSGHLSAVLLQYPPWFVPKRANRDELARLPERLGGLKACVELRSPKWYEQDDLDRVLALLRKLGLAWVVVDAPRSSGLPSVLEATSDLAVVRFHGRADSTWNSRVASAAERFRYLYSDQELDEWAPRALQLAKRTSELHLLMNNCYQDYGVRNAAQLSALLADKAGTDD